MDMVWSVLKDMVKEMRTDEVWAEGNVAAAAAVVAVDSVMEALVPCVAYNI